jgi:UPF0755 protein
MRSQSTGAGSGNRRSGCFSTLGGLILAALVCRIIFGIEVSPVAPGDHSKVRLTIQSGAGSRVIARALADKGLVRNAEVAVVEIALSGKGSELKAGAYALSRSMSLDEMIDRMASGKTDTVAIVIPEGFTTEQIAERLASKKLVDQIDFVKAAATEGQGFVFDDGFAPPRNLEGYLFPLTYNFVRGSTPHEIVQQMLDEFDKHVVSRHPDMHNWHDAIIVASLVEREAKIDSDRPLIASVYYNRLKAGMALQCDATVQYALPAHKSRLMYSDLRIDSPYNTYLRKGLPPGPICNPGLLSIEAAINPANTDYLFYVAGPTGAHIFSRTLAQQDRAIAAVRTSSRE